ncbi:aminopeptidase N-like isoform X2 [Watersipora subatra]|uniref:aminopeptidase N-like isoform X2 n=1 Tax=Watersipora subatra TaxID=2589382 RepID=UPI00355B9954
MSELEDVSFWPGSSDGSYTRVGRTNAPVVTCKKRTVLILVAVVAVLFIISVSIPAGMLTHYKNHYSEHVTPGTSKGSVPQPTVPQPTVPQPTVPQPTVPQTSTTPVPTASSTPLATTTAKPVFPSWGKYRLPGNVKPRFYNISIVLQLFGNETNEDQTIPYSGTVLIVVNVTKATDSIVLHAVDMDISAVQVAKCAEGEDYCSGFAKVKDYRMTEGDLQQLEIQLNQNYSVNTTLNLKLEFNTTLRDDLRGFYKSSYSVGTESHKTTTLIATTQFESVFARKAFPCFDEPSFKAKFALNITRPKTWLSLFNSPLLANITYDETRMLDIYSFSPTMSSYLVAFVVCDFGNIPTKTMTSQISSNTINITVYGQKAQLSQLSYASEVAVTVIGAYEDFFETAYPLPKLDIIAIPDFAAGAMENWGLITFRESALLYDPSSSSSNQQQYVTYVIAHELAHQWFGNLVTMEWWNELWLNEGFATFVGKLIGTEAANVDESWPIAEDFRFDVAGSLELDGLITSHPLSVPHENVTTPDEIEAMFDDITYTKGSGILNMLYNFVSPNVTKGALKDYLNIYQYGNARAEDLWSCFDKAFKEENTQAPKKQISAMMNSWTSASGYPYVTASRTDDGIYINQTQFFLCSTCNKSSVPDSSWVIPMIYQTSTSPSTSDRYTLDSTNGQILSTDLSWALLNLNWTGYYHVLYTNRDTFPDLKIMTDIDIANAVSDMTLLFRGGHVEPDKFVTFLASVVNSSSADYLTWRILLSSMQYLLDIHDQQFDKYQTVSGHVYEWLNVPDMNLTFAHVDNMAVKYRTLLSSKLSMALNINHEKVLRDIPYMKNLTTLWLSTLSPNSSATTDKVVHNDVALQVWTCAYQSNESAGLWAKLWAKYKFSKIASERSRYMVVLASGKDNSLLRHYLDYGLAKAKDDETVGIISLVARNRRSRLDTWDFVKTNWPKLIERYANQGFSMETLIKSTTNYFSDVYKLRDMQQFFSANELGAGQLASRQSLEIVRANIFMMERLSNPFINAILDLDS